MNVSMLIRDLEAYRPELEVSFLCHPVEGKNGYDIAKIEIGRDVNDRPMIVLISKERK